MSVENSCVNEPLLRKLAVPRLSTERQVGK